MTMLICTKAKSPVIALPLEVSNLCLRGGCAGAHDPMPCALRVPNHLDYQDCQTSPAVPQQQRALQHGRKLPHDTRLRVFAPPANATHDGWAGAILANQFPRKDSRSCERLLVITNDAINSGFGHTAYYYAGALLLAMRQNRVLVEVGEPNVSTARWCGQPPWTFECFYDPWSSCLAPRYDKLPPKPRALDLRRRYFNQKDAIIRVTPQWLLHYMNGADQSSAYPAALRFLFGRPRAWVRRIGDCIRSRDGLASRNFLALFIRESKEKRVELKRHGHGTPPVAAYHSLAHSLATATGEMRVLLQTSSDQALSAFSKLAEASGLRLSFTDNARSDNDAWDGWRRGQREGEQGAIAAVNLHMASSAAVFIGPLASSWTHLVAHTMHERSVPLLYPCCRCRTSDLYLPKPQGGRANLVVVAAAEPGPSFRRVDIRELPKPHSCESLTRPDSSLRFVRWDPRTRSPVYNNVSSSRDAPT